MKSLKALQTHYYFIVHGTETL